MDEFMFVRTHKSVLSTHIQKMEAEENIGQVGTSNAPFSGESSPWLHVQTKWPQRTSTAAWLLLVYMVTNKDLISKPKKKGKEELYR